MTRKGYLPKYGERLTPLSVIRDDPGNRIELGGTAWLLTLAPTGTRDFCYYGKYYRR